MSESDSPNSEKREIRVAPSTLNDLDELAPLFDSYRQFYGQRPDIESARTFLAERLENGDSQIFLAKSNSRPAGFVQLYPSFSSVGMNRIWILNDLFVARDERQAGIAGELLGCAVAFAKSNSAARLVLATQIENRPARKLYEKFGWTMDEDFVHYQFDLTNEP